jgi:hypothetical protein
LLHPKVGPLHVITDGSSTHPIGWVYSALCQEGKDYIEDSNTVQRPACTKEEKDPVTLGRLGKLEDGALPMLKGELGRMYRLDCVLDECYWFEDYHSTPMAWASWCEE